MSNQPGATLAIVGLLVLAALVYAWTVLLLMSAGGSDAAGNGLTTAFTLIGEAILWILLAAIMLFTCAASDLPVAVRAGALMMLPIAVIAAFVAIDGMDTHRTWLATPLLLPVLIGAFAGWAMLAQPKAARTTNALALTSLAIAIGLCALPLVGLAASRRAATTRAPTRNAEPPAEETGSSSQARSNAE